MYSVILCGGSGTRLWPMSRKNFPKQFLRLYGKYSLLQETYLRTRAMIPSDHIFFVTNEENAGNVLGQIRELEKEFPETRIIMEPAARNTAPAIGLALKYLTAKMGIGENEPVLFLPSDHHIGKKEAYFAIVEKALSTGGDHIGTIGITPTRPETGYGYIRKEEKRADGGYDVAEFKEKPDLVTAERYLASGEYAWNSGMYFFNARTFFEELSAYAPEIASFFSEGFDALLARYASIPTVSIDYAVSEKSKRVIMFEGDFGWSDIGSFDSLADIVGHNPAARQIGIDSKNIYAYSKEDRLIATIGVEDLIIVESGDSILICKRGHTEDVKKVVEELKKNGGNEL